MTHSNLPVTEFDYKFNDDVLWSEYNRLFNEEQPDYEFYKHGVKIKKKIVGFKVLGSQIYGENLDSPLLLEAKRFVDHFDIEDDYIALFLWMAKDFNLDWHTDDSEVCSSTVNYIMSDSPQPINFRDGKYDYKCAAIDVMKEHRVENGQDERVLFRVTFKNLTYDELVKHVKEK